MEPTLLTALKALSDASRLRIVGLLADGRPRSVSELADALRLTPGTVVRHLKLLSEAELVAERLRPAGASYSLRLQRLSEIGGRLDVLTRSEAGLGGRPADAPAWASDDQAKVLRSFFDGERLASIPAHNAKRLVVLRHLAATAFEPDVEYPEKEVNARLALRHADTAALRRYLVDEGFMVRQHSIYRLRPSTDWPL